MKSPFAIFRKHQKVLMVVLTGLAMFAFVVLDSLTQNMAAFPPIMGFVLGLGIAWAITRGQSYSWAWLLVGGIAGGMLGSQLQTATARIEAAVTTSFGSFSPEELDATQRRQQIVNQFLRQAFFKVNEGEERPDTSPLDNSMFGFGQDPQRSALLHLMLMQEAEKMKISVSDDQVTNLIDSVTEEQLLPQEFNKIILDLRISGRELFDLIREQMTAKQALRLLQPSLLASPEDYWKAFKKLNVKQELAVVPLDVQAFLPSVSEPSDADLKALFEEFKDKIPGEENPEDPGFRQPGRIKLGYLEIDYDTVEKTIPSITEAEVKAYYEANKEEYRNNVTPEFPPGMQPPGAQATPTGEPLEGPALIGPGTNTDQPEAPEMKEGASPQDPAKPADSAEKTPESSTEKPAPETPKPAADEESKAPETPKSEEKPAAAEDAKPEEPKSEAPESSASETPEEPAQPASEKPGTPEGTGALFSISGTAFASIKDETPEPEVTQTPPPAKQPAATKPPESEPKPASETPTESESGDNPAKPEDSGTPAPKPESDPTDKPTTAEKPDEDSKPAATPDKPETTAPEMPAPPAPEAPAEPLPEFKPLDESLTEQIREQLLEEKTRIKMAEMSREALGFLVVTNAAYATAGETLTNEKKIAEAKAEAAASIRSQVEQYAQKNGMRYVETPYYSIDELEESEDHPIGRATEPVDNPFNRPNARTVIEQLFAVEDLDALIRLRYRPIEAEDGSTLNRFIHWQVDFKKPHVATWDEAGVQEEVKEAWKKQQAQELALNRAQEIAEMLKTSSETWAETLAEKTVTGKDGDEALIVSYTGPFSWITQSSVSQTNPFAPRRLEFPTIPVIFGGINNEFMETVFDEMNSGEIGTVWGADRRYVFVVRVDDRTELEEVRSEFLAPQTRLFASNQQFELNPSPYPSIVQVGQQQVMNAWQERLNEQYEVKWKEDDE